MSQMIASLEQGENATIARIAGKIDMLKSPQLHQALLDVCKQKPAHLLIDLAGVVYLDSSGVSTLVDIARKVKDYSGRLTLVGPNTRVRSVFEVTRLDRFFRIVDTQEEALSS